MPSESFSGPTLVATPLAADTLDIGGAALFGAGLAVGGVLSIGAGGVVEDSAVLAAGTAAGAAFQTAITLGAGAVLAASGTILAGNFSESGLIAGPGTILAETGGTLALAAGEVSGGATLAIAPGAVLEAGPVDPLFGVFDPTALTIAASVVLAFETGAGAPIPEGFGGTLGEAGGVLVLPSPDAFSGTIEGFAPGDLIEFPGLTGLGIADVSAHGFQVAGVDGDGGSEVFTIAASLPTGATPFIETDSAGDPAIGLRAAGAILDLGGQAAGAGSLRAAHGVAEPIPGLDLLLATAGSGTLALTLAVGDGVLGSGTLAAAAAITLAASSAAALDADLAGLVYTAGTAGSGDVLRITGQGVSAAVPIALVAPGGTLAGVAGAEAGAVSAIATDAGLIAQAVVAGEISVSGEAAFAGLVLAPGIGGTALVVDGGGLAGFSADATFGADVVVGGMAGAATLALLAGAQSIAGTLAIVAGSLADVAGTLGLGEASVGGTLEITGTVNAGGVRVGKAGTLALSGGTLMAPGISFAAGGVLAGTGRIGDASGTLALAAGSTISVDGAATGTIAFAGGGALLSLGDLPLDSAAIAAFAATDGIDLPRIAPASVTIGGGGITVAGEGALAITATPGAPALQAASDGTGGTLVTVGGEAPCFARGTHLLTPAGYRAVEDLRPGDPVVTQAGGVLPIGWIGHRLYDLGGAADAARLAPVRIEAQAFGPGLPRRALRLSPLHCIFYEGILVPAAALVNGTTVSREAGCLAVTYFHVELGRHAVLLAEGLPAESYLDTGNRRQFAAAAGHPGGRAPRLCAPVVPGGPRLAPLRARLHRRALALGFRTVREPDLALRVGGRSVPATYPRRHVLCFALPEGARHATFHARAGIPAETDPMGADRRTLGVCVGALRVDGVALALAPPVLGTGWLPAGQGDAGRWMGPRADILLPGGARALEVELTGIAARWRAPALALFAA